VSSSIDGLVSGLSTSSLISSLMKVEAAPQTRLKTKVTAAETVVKAYQAVNSKIAALKTASDDLSQLSTWRGIKPESSSTAVTATATGGVNNGTGSVTFDVKELARAQVQTARFPAAPDVEIAGKKYGAPVTSAASFEIKVGDAAPVTITLGDDKSAKGISDAINAKGLNVKSTVLTTDTGEKILQLSSSKTGVANAFTIDPASLPLTDPNNASQPVTLVEEVAAKDAELQVHVAGGYTLKSATNTFTGLMSGVTLTATKVEDNVTVSSSQDVSGIAAKFQALVDAANAALTETQAQTAYDPATKKGAALSGDFATRQISTTLLSTVSQGLGKLNVDDATAFGSLSQLGIQLDRSGKLSFDAGKFTAAYNKNPETIQAAGIAFADGMEAVTTKQSTGITAAINGRKSLIDSMNAQIDNWGVRLNARQEALQKQYATLETSLSKLNSQSTWLSGQIASLG
jgi:flagellar hook-associated protein 2